MKATPIIIPITKPIVIPISNGRPLAGFTASLDVVFVSGNVSGIVVELSSEKNWN